MLKGDMDYNPTVAKAAIMTLRAVSHSYGAFFPAGSDQGQTKASPKIWEDMAGFKAVHAKYLADVKAAVAAAPADVDALKAQFDTLGSDCGTCHQTYRIKKG